MEAADQVLAGAIDTNKNINAATKEIFQELRQIWKTIPPDLVQEIIRTVDWRTYWSKAWEETASSVSSLQFGHYKAGARSMHISHLHAMNAAVAIKTRLGLDRWAWGLSVMLEKIPGCHLVTKLWSILLMEADFNCTNKIIYGNRMLESA